MVQCLLVYLFNFKRFASFFNHDVDNNFVGFFHAFFSQGANVGKGFFNIFAYNAVAGLVVIAGFAHVVTDNACFNGVGIIADNTAVETPVVTLSAQLGFAPSQIMPLVTPTALVMVWPISSSVAPCR